MKQSAFFVLSLLFTFSLAYASELADTTPVTILRFHQVSPSLYRGARPESVGLTELKALGIKTDLNLDNDVDSNRSEKAQAEALGIQYVSQPLSGFWAPEDAQINQILSIMNDPANFPIYIHCLHGQDRTGLLVGLYRIYTEGWTPAAAYTEMLNLGFHRSLVKINHYFETKTGYIPRRKPAPKMSL